MTFANGVLAGRDSAYPNRVYAWVVVALLQLAYAVALVDRQILSLLVEPIRASLHISDTQFSLLAGAAFAIFYGFMGLVLGRFADTVNRRNMIVVGMLLWSVATMVCGLAQSFGDLFVARIAVGVGEAALSPAAYSMIADYFPPERRSRATAIYAMGLYFGAGAALVFGGAAIAATSSPAGATLPFFGHMQSWQATFVIVGLPGIIVAAIMLLAVREPLRREVQEGRSSWIDSLGFIRRNAGILTLVITPFSVGGLIYYSIVSWSPALFIRRFDWTAPEIGTALGIILMTFGTAGSLFSGWWASRPQSGPRRAVIARTTRIGLAGQIPVVLLIALAPTDVVTLLAIGVLVFLTAMTSALLAVSAYEITPNQFRGQVISLYMLAGTLFGLGAGVTLIASITDYVFHDDLAVNKSMAIVIGVGAIVGTLCLNAVIRRQENHLVAASVAA